MLYWAVSFDLLKCGYFTISLTTTLPTTMRLPNISHYYWPTLPGFQAPLQGVDYLQDLTHTISTTWNSSHVIAHYNPSQYIINRMNYFAKQIYSMEKYATQTSLIAFMKEPCQHINITMDIIQRSTGDIYGYAFHHFVYHLTLKPNSEFTFTDYLLIEQRFIRFYLQSEVKCDAGDFVLLNINPTHPLMPGQDITMVTGKPRYLQENRFIKQMEDYRFIIMYDAFTVSWNEAKDICSNLDSHLPVIKSEDDRILLEQFLLGKTFRESTSSEYFRPPCRHNNGPYCGTYIGLHFRKTKGKTCFKGSLNPILAMLFKVIL